MRCAVVLALGDPRSEDAGTWVDAAVWLRQELSDRGYRVAVVDGEDVEADLAAALEDVTPDDEVLLHMSGRIVRRGVVRTASGRWVRMHAFGEALAARAGSKTSVFAELLHDEGPAGEALAADHVSAVADAFGARARGFALVASVRAASAPIEGLALTRLFCDADGKKDRQGLVLSSALCARVRSIPRSSVYAREIAFVRGSMEGDIDAPSLDEPIATRPSVSGTDRPSEAPVHVGGAIGPAEDDLSELSDLSLEQIQPDVGDPAVHERAFVEHWRAGRTDAALLAAHALEELDAADVDQQILIDQFRSVTPIRALGTLDQRAWLLLRPVDPCSSGGALTALFAAVTRVAVVTRLELLAARKRLVRLDPAHRLDPTGTASVVRSFQWAARVLGVGCPALYAVDHVPGEIAAVRAPEPSTALGPSVLRGRTVKDLAFLAGRHLTYYRPEHQVLVYFPTGEDLGRLLAATLSIAGTRALPAIADPKVSALREELERRITRAERAAVIDAAGGVDPRTDVGAWARGVELAAGRAGLLLCGDLMTAGAIVRSESREVAGLTVEGRRRDLVAFCSSPEHGALRARFAVTAPESVRPPAPQRVAEHGAAYSP